MKFAVFNAAGFPLAFYSVDVHGNSIPAEATQITDEQWIELAENQNSRRWDGSQVVPYAPPPDEPPFPSVVTAAQAKIALHQAGRLEQVKAIVAAHPYEIVRIWYGDANQWERGNPYVQGIGVELAMTEDEIDALFIAASKV